MYNINEIMFDLESPIEEVREKAIIALTKSNDIRVIPKLQKIIDNDPSVQIRYFARKALWLLKSRIGNVENGSVEELDPKNCTKKQIDSYLNDENVDKRLSFVKWIAKFQVKKAKPMLLKKLDSEPDPLVRATIILAIGIVGVEGDHEILFRYLRDPNSRIRANTIEALEYFDNDEIYEKVLPMVMDEDNRVKTNAIKILGKSSKINTAEFFHKMIASDKVSIRDSAAYALSEIGKESDLPLILRLLKDPKKTVREKARQALARIAETSSKAASIYQQMNLLKDDENVADFYDLLRPDLPKVKKSKKKELEELFDEDTTSAEKLNIIQKAIIDNRIDLVPKFIKLLKKEKDPYILSSLIIAIGNLGKKRHIVKLMPFLEFDVDRVRASAVESLSRLDDMDVKDSFMGRLHLEPNNRALGNLLIGLKDYQSIEVNNKLQWMVNSSDYLMKATAIYVINDIASDTVIKMLKKLMTDEFSEIQLKAVSTLRILKDNGNALAAKILEDAQQKVDDMIEDVLEAVEYGDFEEDEYEYEDVEDEIDEDAEDEIDEDGEDEIDEDDEEEIDEDGEDEIDEDDEDETDEDEIEIVVRDEKKESELKRKYDWSENVDNGVMAEYLSGIRKISEPPEIRQPQEMKKDKTEKDEFENEKLITRTVTKKKKAKKSVKKKKAVDSKSETLKKIEIPSSAMQETFPDTMTRIKQKKKNDYKELEKSDSKKKSILDLMLAKRKRTSGKKVSRRFIDSVSSDIDEKVLDISYKKFHDITPARLKMVINQFAPFEAVNAVLCLALNQGASDIHFEAGYHDMVRIRVDGYMRELIKTSKIFFTKMVSRIKIMCEMDITKSLPQDARFSVKVDDGNIAFRVSTYPTVFGDRIVLRVLGQEKSLVSLDNLGFYADDLIKIRENLHQPYGLILVTGPTGSGKSTTNYSMLNELNDSLKTIITVEDPVEILIEGINQSQIDPSSTRDDKEKFTFKRALKHILRQDPDIILIGELRDEESLTTAIRAATTGHLVFSTLHSNSVASSIMYLLDIGLSPKIFRSVVNFIISQRLVRKLCPDCKERIKITSEIADFLEVKHTEVDDLVVYEQNPYGCEKCNYIGYLGRTNIYEFLTMSSEIEECIMSDKFSSALLHEVAKKELGMQTMLENGIQKVKDGLISVEELFLAVGHKY